MWHVRERGEVHAGFWWENPMRTAHLEDLGVDGNIKLKWIFKNWNGGHGSGIIWLKIRKRSIKKSHEPPCYVKCKAFLDGPTTYDLLKDNSAPQR
jgi:hypothetical protein